MVKYYPDDTPTWDEAQNAVCEVAVCGSSSGASLSKSEKSVWIQLASHGRYNVEPQIKGIFLPIGPENRLPG
ncbi:hypothetical protein [Methylococcus sp. EFPC2]|uniref:hypothetical protein n=1 Tax=Methylococcus sp. EFPC2 TaxID=2812648 RepID=UPI001967C3E4|nr:hypothetical protein [Methylococcus sp. EFPC2]QSA98536.1 hypothetical protein JWZ97_06990 [Methylococcus sp. EFPC2]